MKKKKRRQGEAGKGRRPGNVALIVDTVKKVGDPLCESEGLELVHAECAQGDGDQIVRLYVDKPGGVTLDDCINISRQMGDLLDVNLPGDTPYRLEVSSPGTDRPLSRRRDFERFAGKTVKIKVDKPVDGQRNFKGVLKGFFEESVEITAGDKTIAIPFHTIAKARLVGDDGDNDPCL